MKRSKHGLSHYKLLTCDMGELVPLTCFEVLPGDSVQQVTSVLVRLSPLLAPVMHPVQVRVHHWFVPHRLVWDEWEDFITGGSDGLGDGSTFPIIQTAAVQKGSLYDYLGIPIGAAASYGFSALPVRSFWKIYNEFYRDQDLVPEVAEHSETIPKVAWEKDYFTTARPWPQKGPDVTLPLGIEAPVRGIGTENQSFPLSNQVAYGSAGAETFPFAKYINTVQPERAILRGTSAVGGNPYIYADLTNASAVNINDVRKAFAVQRYQEARAQYGSRYTEYLRYLGVRSSDARLQRPEYLGGGKATVSFSEVLQTGPDADPGEGVANLKGHGIAALRSRRYRRFFEEHGCVLSLLSVRPRVMYSQGQHRMWNRRTKEDYWQRELELIGQQEILAGEIYKEDGGATLPTATWGFGDRYSEYRHLPSQVAGDFRDTLDFWHMARKFAAFPPFNKSFIECDPTKRIHAVQTEDVLWVMANHSIQARRMVTKRTIGAVL